MKHPAAEGVMRRRPGGERNGVHGSYRGRRGGAAVIGPAGEMRVIPGNDGWSSGQVGHAAVTIPDS